MAIKRNINDRCNIVSTEINWYNINGRDQIRGSLIAFKHSYSGASIKLTCFNAEFKGNRCCRV